ncbi:hypothetical protein [Streptomyces sp. ICC1]|uniref:hypothetical protein n=2 Tax=unclassified Streptomyces TaxID=2593676 RepID=UPI000DC7AC5F|nr:hypothetical protein [Streptomyces sp. ICC1]AWZ07123.1 hypothetical protein DRB89_23665 [Streptomyces sp. ICC4]AWZ14856.1 hypothetical protein DRB96_24255 [Streptomyces sp. ICC1]
MTTLFERLDEEELNVRKELGELRTEIAAAEEHLIRLTITRDTLLSLVNDTSQSGDPAVPDESGRPDTEGDQSDPAASTATAEPAPPSGPLGLEEARERILTLLAGSGRALKVNDITAAIGEDPTRVETTRSRLKRLVKEVRVAEGPTAWFTIALPAEAAEGGTPSPGVA